MSRRKEHKAYTMLVCYQALQWKRYSLNQMITFAISEERELERKYTSVKIELSSAYKCIWLSTTISQAYNKEKSTVRDKILTVAIQIMKWVWEKSYVRVKV